MKKKKLARIQWRLLRFGMLISVGASFLVFFFLFFYSMLEYRRLFSVWVYDIPLVLVIFGIILLVGAVLGYLFGHGLKYRLEKLVESVMKLERGDFSHRVPPTEEDEIGLMGDHLNRMAERIQQQVSSLQKLSTERAEWRDHLKKSVIIEERQRIARDLHDAVSQQLFAISMMSSAVLVNPTLVDEKMKKQVAMIEKMSGHAQSEMRALLLHLRPATLEGKRLKEGLEELLIEFRDKQQTKIEWDIEDLNQLPKGIEDQLFRIVQEGLSNVFRHSRATSVTVRLHSIRQQIHLKIVDNGIGFEMRKAKASTYGLQSIQERVSEIGGVVEIISFPNKGTQLDVKVPIVDVERGNEP